MGRALRVVEGEGDTPATDGSISDAAGSGSRIAVLRALRTYIARQLDEGVPPRDLASLSLRLVKITEELEKLEADGEDEVADAADTPDEPWPAR